MAGSFPVAWLIPSIIGTMFLLLGLLYVIGMWADETWDKYKTLKRYRTNKAQIESLYINFRVGNKVPNQIKKLIHWIWQEEPLLKWREIGILIPVQKQLIQALK